MSFKRPLRSSKQKNTYRGRRVGQPSNWRMPSMAACAMLVLGCVIGAGMWRQWVWLLDTFTLALHEAGHPIVGLFSANMMVYGGTFFQLLFPWLTKRHFENKGSPAGVVFGLYWMAASIHNVGIYVSDARAKALPLVGGLDPEDAHDWAEILWRWNLLPYDTTLGKILMFIAWLMLGWAMWRCYRDVRDAKPIAPSEKLEHLNKEQMFLQQFQHLRETSIKPHAKKKTTTPVRPEPEEED